MTYSTEYAPAEISKNQVKNWIKLTIWSDANQTKRSKSTVFCLISAFMESLNVKSGKADLTIDKSYHKYLNSYVSSRLKNWNIFNPSQGIVLKSYIHFKGSLAILTACCSSIKYIFPVLQTIYEISQSRFPKAYWSTQSSSTATRVLILLFTVF